MINAGCFRGCLLSKIPIAMSDGRRHAPGGFLLHKPIKDLTIWESKRGRWTLPDFLGLALQDKGQGKGRVGHKSESSLEPV